MLGNMTSKPLPVATQPVLTVVPVRLNWTPADKLSVKGPVPFKSRTSGVLFCWVTTWICCAAVIALNWVFVNAEALLLDKPDNWVVVNTITCGLVKTEISVVVNALSWVVDKLLICAFKKLSSWVELKACRLLLLKALSWVELKACNSLGLSAVI